MLLKVYAKLASMWFLSTIVTIIIVPLTAFLLLFPILVTLAAFIDLELDFSSILPAWWLLAAIPLSFISILIGLSLEKTASVALIITKEVGLMLLWAPPLLLFLWFIGIFNPTAFNNLCERINDKLDDLNLTDMLEKVL